ARGSAATPPRASAAALRVPAWASFRAAARDGTTSRAASPSRPSARAAASRPGPAASVSTISASASTVSFASRGRLPSACAAARRTPTSGSLSAPPTPRTTPAPLGADDAERDQGGLAALRLGVLLEHLQPLRRLLAADRRLVVLPPDEAAADPDDAQGREQKARHVSLGVRREAGPERPA